MSNYHELRSPAGVNASQFNEALRHDPALSSFIAQTHAYALLTRDQERAYGERAACGDTEARQKLILHNQRLAVAIAKKFLGRGLPLADIIDEGMIGLMSAVDHYRPAAYKARFVTYAGWWITQRIQRALIDTGTMVRVPVYVISLRSKAYKASREYASSHNGALPPVSLLATLIGAKLDVLTDALRDAHMADSLASLDALLQGDNDSLSLGDTLEDDSASFADLLAEPAVDDERDYSDLYATLARVLTERERVVITLLYGLGGRSALSYGAVSERLKIHHTTVKILEKAALGKLRQAYGVDVLALLIA